MEPTADRYRRAAVELAQTSELQVEWALAVAGDEALLALIDELPPVHRQPSLLFSVARLLGQTVGAMLVAMLFAALGAEANRACLALASVTALAAAGVSLGRLRGS